MTTQERELYEAYFQKDADYYIQRVEYYDEGHRFTFNFYAFFFGFAWLLYRKMYLQSLCLFLLFTVEIGLESYVLFPALGYGEDGPPGFDKIINILLASLVGGLANFFYIRQAKDCIAKAMSLDLSHDQTLQYIRQKGGVDWRWLLVVLLLGICIFALYMVL